MYPASAAYKAAIRTDHKIVSKAEIWSGANYLATLQIDTGKVSVSVSSAVRRTCSVHLSSSVGTTNLVPDNGFDLLAPFGNELRLYRGIEFTNGTIEYIPLGVFVMTDVKIQDDIDGVSISITGEDRSIFVSRNKWTQPYQMVSGTLESSLTTLLQNRWIDVVTDFPTTNVSINQVIFGADNSADPWKDCVNLCALVGYDLYFDVNGVAVLKQFPSLDASVVVATYKEGENTIITSLDRSISTKETYNGVIYTVEGSQVTTPIRVEVWDEDTTSPTYRYGVFGQAPTFVTSNLVASTSEAIKAATLLLNTYIGAQEEISWNAIVDPSLDVNDVVYIKSTGSKVDRLVIIDSLDVPLMPEDSLNAKARVVRVVDVGESVQVGS
jgi:hypothetical protein